MPGTAVIQLPAFAAQVTIGVLHCSWQFHGSHVGDRAAAADTSTTSHARSTARKDSAVAAVAAVAVAIDAVAVASDDRTVLFVGQTETAQVCSGWGGA